MTEFGQFLNLDKIWLQCFRQKIQNCPQNRPPGNTWRESAYSSGCHVVLPKKIPGQNEDIFEMNRSGTNLFIYRKEN